MSTLFAHEGRVYESYGRDYPDSDFGPSGAAMRRADLDEAYAATIAFIPQTEGDKWDEVRAILATTLLAPCPVCEALPNKVCPDQGAHALRIEAGMRLGLV